MATSSVLYAAAKEIGATCESENRAFLACKVADEDPSACLRQGEAVQSCALRVLKSAMRMCDASFQAYAQCLDSQISEEYKFERCRREEGVFQQCRSDVQQAEGAGAASMKEANE